MDKCKLIGVAGGSGSGKGFVCRHVQEKLSPEQCVILPIDAYYRDLSHLSAAQREAHNFDMPEAIDHPLFIEQLRVLLDGGTVAVPDYDFESHTRRKSSLSLCASGKIVLVEGLFALYWEEVRQLLSVRIFIDLDWRTCLARRIERDLRERGRTRESVEGQFAGTVLPMYRRHVEPTRKHADLVLQGDAAVNESVDQVMLSLTNARPASASPNHV